MRPAPRRRHRPAALPGQQLSSPDIRAGMAMLLAALCAEGSSTIGNVRQIDRGYERIDERLRALGASIERVEGVAECFDGSATVRGADVADVARSGRSRRR